ncbi:hypothetical protein BBO99_00007509 [Phytophthora kernoviae]|uniref:Glucose-methanol-choline oxidoreductase N-terminal domain-containing protein n=1 Tax=Phytophthora kernoviae TaxID=325452 RepID=A0A3R7J0U3_9STRA|nr:hypothetical protein JM18_007024 [Phytophthora kernoviae]RLN02632.1 hypothetical protein BBI17_007423 [Phytophthora kernoviae]RLN76496.1 hypothetical protein BBO99_00007509 [Phytophthora kernoviae]
MLRHSLWSSLPQRRALSSLSITAKTKEFDYVVVGGGSAGCVLANRLSADSSNSVLLLETGPSDRGLTDSIRLAMPGMLPVNFVDDRYNWDYMTEPQKHLNGRRLSWPRGRVLGGSSSINAMIYSRGHVLDYEDWQAAGAYGWGYADCLPYFRKAQTHALGANDYRGDDGPLQVTRRTQPDQPLFQAFIDAAVQAGYPFTDDVNGYQQEGVGWLDLTIHKGERSSASAAYLTQSVLDRENLTVLTGSFVNKILFEGKKAVGVEVEPHQVSTKEAPTQIRAMKEVILSSGAINSPQLLMLSGVGDAQHLKEVGVPVVHHLPAVGQNMEDHLGAYLHVTCKKPITLYHSTPHFPHKMAWIGIQWLASRSGPGISSHIEAGGFFRSAPGKRRPDVKWQFVPGATDERRQVLRDGHAMMLHCATLRATSRGFIKLRSADPRESPIIQPNYLDTESDRVNLRNSVRLTREVLAQEAFEEFRGDAISPTESVQSDAEIDAWIRQHAATDYHPSSTNRMGNDNDANTVVDPQARVHGLEGLRIVDASIMPNNVSGNLNAPTIMVAEKTADLILGIAALPKAGVPVYESRNWETSQSGFLVSPSQPSQKIIITKEPVGVCGIMTPWNFPYAILGLNLAPPLAAGCTLVIKPASETPLSMLALARLAEDVGFPPGLINVVTASRDKSDEIARMLTSSKDVRKISFVGSTKVGKSLMRQSAATVKRVSLRLSGNAPFIVFNDANMEQALNGLMETKFSNSGQVCIASNRIFIHSSIYDEFTTKLVERVKLLKMGSPLEHGVQLGPLIDTSVVKKVSELVDDAVQHGAKVLSGGKTSKLGKNFYEATVLTNVDESMHVWQEEIFGPVVPLFTFSSEEEVVRKANDTPMGLAGYFYTRDVARMFRVASELECGMVGVNSSMVKHVGVPYGGVKESGIGREGSPEGLEEYLETKMVCIGGLN